MTRTRSYLVASLALALAAVAWAASPATAPSDEVTITVKTAPPVVVSTTPQAGAVDVDSVTSEIKVTFSKPMTDKSWSWSTWGEENFPKMTGDPRYEPDGLTCVLPVALESGKTYAIWLNSNKFTNFKDTDGRPAVPYLLVFETKR